MMFRLYFVVKSQILIRVIIGKTQRITCVLWVINFTGIICVCNSVHRYRFFDLNEILLFFHEIMAKRNSPTEIAKTRNFMPSNINETTEVWKVNYKTLIVLCFIVISTPGVLFRIFLKK